MRCLQTKTAKEEQLLTQSIRKKLYKEGDDSGPLITKGNDEAREENLGGTTNLTLEQLKKEGDPGGSDDTVA